VQESEDKPPALQMRALVVTEDLERAVVFYRDALGRPEQAAFEGDGDARIAILEAGRATLELAHPAQKRMIDEVEVGRPSGPMIRLAFVSDGIASYCGLSDSVVEILFESEGEPQLTDEHGTLVIGAQLGDDARAAHYAALEQRAVQAVERVAAASDRDERVVNAT
jgi:catechol 2,3-dioxygenase-like lactoylglutathione lyase family enzyme